MFDFCIENNPDLKNAIGTTDVDYPTMEKIIFEHFFTEKTVKEEPLAERQEINTKPLKTSDVSQCDATQLLGASKPMTSSEQGKTQDLLGFLGSSAYNANFPIKSEVRDEDETSIESPKVVYTSTPNTPKKKNPVKGNPFDLYSGTSPLGASLKQSMTSSLTPQKHKLADIFSKTKEKQTKAPTTAKQRKLTSGNVISSITSHSASPTSSIKSQFQFGDDRAFGKLNQKQKKLLLGDPAVMSKMTSQKVSGSTMTSEYVFGAKVTEPGGLGFPSKLDKPSQQKANTSVPKTGSNLNELFRQFLQQQQQKK